MSSNGSCGSSNCCHHHDNNSSTWLLYRPPTEGQLQWAKLHHKKRAALVQTAIRRLWLTPTTYAADNDNRDLLDGGDGGGEQRDDICFVARGQQIVDDNDDNNGQPVGISQGRWDLLRHSQYKYEQRRKVIAVNGFRRHHQQSSESDNNNNAHSEQVVVTPVGIVRHAVVAQRLGTNHHPMQHPASVSTNTRRATSRLCHSAVVRQNRWNDLKRARHVKMDAFHSAVRNNSVSRQEKEDISQRQLPLSSPKYHVRNGAWSGPLDRNTSHTSQDEDDENSSSSVNNNSSFSFTGWGSTIVPTRPAAVRNPIVMYNQCLAPMDRSASWLVHVPTKKQKPMRHSITTTNNSNHHSYVMPSSYSTADHHDRHQTTTTQIAKLYGPLVSSASARTTRNTWSPYRRSPRLYINEELRNDTATTTSQNRLLMSSSSSRTIMERDVGSIINVASAPAVVSPSAPNAHGSTTTTTRYIAAENQVPMVILPTVTYDSDDDKDDDADDEVRDDSEDAGGILDESSIDKAVDDTFALALVLDTSLVFNESTLDNNLASSVPFDCVNHHDEAARAADGDLRRIALQPHNETTTTSLNRQCIVGDSMVPTNNHHHGDFTRWSTSNQHAVSAVETCTLWMSSSGRSGCGLSSNRHNHLQSQSIMAYDAQWERRFMM